MKHKKFPFPNLNGNKVNLNSNQPNCNNCIFQLVCPDRLLTFVPPTFAPKLFKIHVLPKDEDEPQSKKPKKNYNISRKYWKIWTYSFHGLRCCEVNMEKYIISNAFFICLWKARMLFQGQSLTHLKSMQEKRRWFMTCRIG